MMNKGLSGLIKKLLPINKNNVDDKIINIGPFQLLANGEHRLDKNLAAFPAYSQNFPRLCLEILKEKKTDITIIDIGANIGDTAALLRKYDVKNRIICIEGDEVFFSYLRKNVCQMKDISLQQYFLTDKTDNNHYTVKNEKGTAQIIKSEVSDVKSGVITLDELSQKVDLGEIGVIKIDTDGFDSKIIRGATRLIKEFKPVLFFEYDYDLSKLQDENPMESLLLLNKLGYSGIIYFDNLGRAVTTGSLENVSQLKILDKYIRDGRGAFPYYDVFVFHEEDNSIFQKIIESELVYEGLF